MLLQEAHEASSSIRARLQSKRCQEFECTHVFILNVSIASCSSEISKINTNFLVFFQIQWEDRHCRHKEAVHYEKIVQNNLT